MQKVIAIRLSGQPTPFQSDESTYNRLQEYLERARLRLARDPDREEVIRDLEQSIGDKLSHRLAGEQRVIELTDINEILDEVGAVDAASGLPRLSEANPRARRRLYRIQEGQWLGGVCQGLAAYSDIRVDWVRSLFVILTVFTGGLLAIAYLAMMFLLPVAGSGQPEVETGEYPSR